LAGKRERKSPDGKPFGPLRKDTYGHPKRKGVVPKIAGRC